MFSLASIVADLLLRKDGQSTLDPLIAAFAVGDGRFAIVAFKDGGVVPDSDVVFASLALAQEAIRALYALLSSKGKEVTVYAPAELEFGGTPRSPWNPSRVPLRVPTSLSRFASGLAAANGSSWPLHWSQ